VRLVNQKEVDVVGLEFLEALACGFEHRVVVAVRDSEFRRQKHLLAIDGGLRDGCTDLAFVAVHLGGVDMARADIECGRHGTPTGRPARAPRAEAECRELGSQTGDVRHILKAVAGARRQAGPLVRHVPKPSAAISVSRTVTYSISSNRSAGV